MTKEPPLRPKLRKPAIAGLWFVRLAGVFYRVERVEVRADDEIVRKAYRFHKEDGTIYDVADTVYGPCCDCGDFVFHKNEGQDGFCKHVQVIQAMGMIGDC